MQSNFSWYFLFLLNAWEACRNYKCRVPLLPALPLATECLAMPPYTSVRWSILWPRLLSSNFSFPRFGDLDETKNLSEPQNLYLPNKPVLPLSMRGLQVSRVQSYLADTSAALRVRQWEVSCSPFCLMSLQPLLRLSVTGSSLFSSIYTVLLYE